MAATLVALTSNHQDLFAAALAPAVPEASTTFSFGLLLALGIGGLVIAKKRKKQSASA